MPVGDLRGSPRSGEMNWQMGHHWHSGPPVTMRSARSGRACAGPTPGRPRAAVSSPGSALPWRCPARRARSASGALNRCTAGASSPCGLQRAGSPRGRRGEPQFRVRTERTRSSHPNSPPRRTSPNDAGQGDTPPIRPTVTTEIVADRVPRPPSHGPPAAATATAELLAAAFPRMISVARCRGTGSLSAAGPYSSGRRSRATPCAPTGSAGRYATSRTLSRRTTPASRELPVLSSPSPGATRHRPPGNPVGDDVIDGVAVQRQRRVRPTSFGRHDRLRGEDEPHRRRRQDRRTACGRRPAPR